MKDQLQKFYPIAFGLCLLLALAYIWIPTYFLTGDGPSHAHNASILMDLLLDQNTALFSSFYYINTEFNPNWLSHIALGLLLQIFPANVSEKILLSSYILLMVIGFRYFLKQLAPGKEWLSVLGFLLIFNHPLQMGFYNSGLSVALMWWALAFYLKWWKHYSFISFVAALSLSVLVWFTHMSGYMYLLLASGCLALTAILMSTPKRRKLQVLAGSIFMHGLPIFLSIFFISKNNDLHIDVSEIIPRLGKLLTMQTLVTLHHTEEYPALMVGLFLIVLFVTGIGRMLFGEQTVKGPGWSYLFLIPGLLLIYFLLPDWMASGGLFNIRTQYITAMFFISGLALVHWTSLQRRIMLGGTTLLFFWLMVVRFPVIMRASEALEDYLSIGAHIEDGSTVIPLSFQHNGLRPNGRRVADRIWLYMHGADYLATLKPLILLSNYEANAGFFPLKWHYERNPFAHLSLDKGIEGQPPNISLQKYAESTGIDIDYVLLWCEGRESGSERQAPLRDDLEVLYDLKAISGSGRAQLYKRNK
jgi:hypothetical protein